MGLKKDYSREVSLRCLTCGADYAFEVDDQTGHVTCHKCNRVYYGGEEELQHLNEVLIADELELLSEELMSDFTDELSKMFKNLNF